MPQESGRYCRRCKDGVERPIAYASRGLSKSERNYSVTKRELLAVVFYCKYFRHYLIGRKFKLRTDHAALRWLQTFKDATGMWARWQNTLAEFNKEIVHRAGRSHGNADGLSRRPNEQPERGRSSDSGDPRNQEYREWIAWRGGREHHLPSSRGKPQVGSGPPYSRCGRMLSGENYRKKTPTSRQSGLGWPGGKRDPDGMRYPNTAWPPSPTGENGNAWRWEKVSSTESGRVPTERKFTLKCWFQEASGKNSYSKPTVRGGQLIWEWSEQWHVYMRSTSGMTCELTSGVGWPSAGSASEPRGPGGRTRKNPMTIVRSGTPFERNRHRHVWTAAWDSQRELEDPSHHLLFYQVGRSLCLAGRDSRDGSRGPGEWLRQQIWYPPSPSTAIREETSRVRCSRRCAGCWEYARQEQLPITLRETEWWRGSTVRWEPWSEAW